MLQNMKKTDNVESFIGKSFSKLLKRHSIHAFKLQQLARVLHCSLVKIQTDAVMPTPKSMLQKHPFAAPNFQNLFFLFPQQVQGSMELPSVFVRLDTRIM